MKTIVSIDEAKRETAGIMKFEAVHAKTYPVVLVYWSNFCKFSSIIRTNQKATGQIPRFLLDAQLSKNPEPLDNQRKSL